MNFENALLTANPLHNKEPTLRVIVEKGGDYPVGTKGKHLQSLRRGRKSFGWHPHFDLNHESNNNHGHIDTRRAAVKALTPVEAGLLSAHSSIKVQREWLEKTCPKKPT